MYNRIDIQLHTECNRKCDWCIFSEKKIDSNFMTEETFENILKYVKNNIDLFDKPLLFVLHKFFEPLLYPELLYKRTKRIKEVFPESIVKINSNCDNLNDDTIYALKYVDKMSVAVYGNYKNLLNYCKIDAIDKEVDDVYFGHINNTLIIMHQHPLKVFSRGGIIFNKKDKYNFDRKQNPICYVYPEYFSVCYDGSIMPCYETVSYFNEHNSMILGNVNQKNLILKTPNFSNECCMMCNADLNSCPSKNR